MRKTHALSLFVAAALGVTAVGAYAKGGAGGASAGHISIHGLADSNGHDALDRDKGRARASDRHEIHAAAHHKHAHKAGAKH
jgi:hypothetical protein